MAACNSSATYELIPTPASVKVHCGSFAVPESVALACPEEMACLATYAEHVFGRAVDINPTGSIAVSVDPNLAAEAYELRVSKSKISIAAADYAGAVHALATVRQLLLENGGEAVPCVSVKDAPAFPWRGFQLDVARHFYTLDEVKTLVYKMADYKYNQFHWHIVDDEGWRIEIKSHPELVAAAAYRDPATHRNDIEVERRYQATLDPAMQLTPALVREDGWYGGYYTQEEVREVVQLCAELGIDVMPELDMPGHSMALTLSHPDLTCTGKASWSITFSNPLCLGKDEIIPLAKEIYSEIFELFPYKYVHLGADEVEHSVWKSCARCQKRIADLDLGDEYGLQAWFVGEMEAFFNENGRELICWDDAIAENLADGTVMQWWRTWRPDTIRKAIEYGNHFFLSPGEFYYLDGTQNRNTIKKVYEYDPLDARVDGGHELVLGVHCNLWCEYVPSFERACYQIFPRFFLVSEAGWAAKHDDFEGITAACYAHMRLLELEGINFRLPDLGGFCDSNVFVEKAEVNVTKAWDSMEVRYTLDGSVPVATSALVEGPIEISEACTLKLRAFTANGGYGDIFTAVYAPAEFLPAVEAPQELSEGLSCAWYNYIGEACDEIDSADLLADGLIIDYPCIPEGVHGNIGLVITGYIEVPEDGIYSFYTDSDDGSFIKIDGHMVVANDGPHSRSESTGQIALSAGLHLVTSRYFDHNGGIFLSGQIINDARVPYQLEFYH